MQISEFNIDELDFVFGGGSSIPTGRDANNGNQGRNYTGVSDGNGGAPSVSYGNPDADTGRHTTRVDPYCRSLGFSAQDCTSSR